MEGNNAVSVELLQGDCLELMPGIPDKSIDLILADLPYGTTRCGFDTIIPFEPLWKQYKRIIKDPGAILLFSQQPFTTDLIVSNRKMFRYEIIWNKTLPTGFLNAKKMPMRYHENICVFYKHLPTYNPQMRILSEEEYKGKPKIGKVRYNGGKAQQYNEFRKDDWQYVETNERYPSDVLEHDLPEELEDVVKFSNWNGGGYYGSAKCAEKAKHPTAKPIDLLEYLIKTYTNEGNTVLDNCMGSGSTGVACVNTGRDFIGMEIDEKYFEVAKQRIKGE